MENQAHILTLAKKINQKDCKFNICDIVRKSKYKIKTILQNAIFQIGLKKFFLLQKLKIQSCGNMLLVILKAQRLLELFTKKNNKKQIEKSLELKK